MHIPNLCCFTRLSLHQLPHFNHEEEFLMDSFEDLGGKYSNIHKKIHYPLFTLRHICQLTTLVLLNLKPSQTNQTIE